MREWLAVLLMVTGCAKALPVKAPEPEARPRPSWTEHLTPHMDAMRACLEEREAPRYVAFVEPLPSGVAGITTVDAYSAVEHCAYFEGRIVRRVPADFGVTDISDANGVLFSWGPTEPIVPVGQVIEEVLEQGKLLGWMFWPKSDVEASPEPKEATP